jgi:hypothetical protein
LKGVLATVYTRDGQHMLHEGEITGELTHRDEELARKEAELERLRRLLDQRTQEE